MAVADSHVFFPGAGKIRVGWFPTGLGADRAVVRATGFFAARFDENRLPCVVAAVLARFGIVASSIPRSISRAHCGRVIMMNQVRFVEDRQVIL